MSPMMGKPSAPIWRTPVDTKLIALPRRRLPCSLAVRLNVRPCGTGSDCNRHGRNTIGRIASASRAAALVTVTVTTPAPVPLSAPEAPGS